MDVEFDAEGEGRDTSAETGAEVEIVAVVEHAPMASPGAVIAEPIAGETTIHRFRLGDEIAAGFDPDALRTAEFWLNAGDGDLALALLLASERLNLAAATESRGFLRGRRLNTARGL